MKLDFHYFTMKFIASRVGFSEQEAQLIASTCQFINDNHQRAALYLPKEQVSKSIIERGLCEDDPSKGPDMCKIPLLLSALEPDNVVESLKEESSQLDILIPFYYFPDQATDKDDPFFDKTQYRVTPIETLQSNEDFTAMFQHAKEQYANSNSNDSAEARQALRRLGVLLHIASDSFAYVPFNGYMSDVNQWTIEEVLDTRTFTNITDQYDSQKYATYPNVGKYRTNGVSEDYNRQFLLTVEKQPRSFIRINNDYFVKAAWTVYSFLSYFRGMTPSEQEWRDNIHALLKDCWNTDSYQYDKLKQHWSKLTSLSYDYDEDAVRQSIVDIDSSLKPDQQGYFDFLLMLQDVKDAVKEKLEEDDVMLTTEDWGTADMTCDISEPNFNGDTYDLTLTAGFPNKVSTLVVLVSIMDTNKQEQIMSDTFTYKNIKSVYEKITLKIPSNDQNLLAKIDFAWRDETKMKKSFNKEYTVIGNAAIISQLTMIEPHSKTNRPSIQIVNGSTSVSADYNYPMNAMYISQEGIAQLDLYAPIDLQLKLADGFKLLDYDNLSISLKPSNSQVIKYCNNSKFISLKTDKDTGIIHIQATEEWKNRIQVKDYSSSIARLKLQIRVTLEVSSLEEDGYRSIVVDTLSDGSLITDLEYMWNQ